MNTRTALCMSLSVLALGQAHAAGLAIGAAPKGDAVSVASRVIKENFPECKRVTKAVRATDGGIHARCDATDYLVFTIFNAKEGKAREVAMNCTAAKRLLNVSC
ncbi:hypothetical protein ACFPN1_16010 [Lysobacter yangpyeongensis]|uniref:Uncharacterized protein n=1 Tax=Lysobacter yangpyeongensis TaxID=346182 RepID=A0ABW0SSK0_9GAMM